MEKDEKGNCRICRHETNSRLEDESHSYHVCELCADKHLGDGDRLGKLDRATAIATIEKITLLYALNVLNGVYDLGEAKRRMAPLKDAVSPSPQAAKKSASVKTSGNCLICRRLTRNTVFNDSYSFHLCADCDKRFFSGYRNSEVKADMLDSAIKTARREKNGFMYALNVELGFYDIEEARRRINAKRQDRGKSATDIFIVGKRLPGSYK